MYKSACRESSKGREKIERRNKQTNKQINTECYSSISSCWNPECEWHEEGQKDTWNDKGVDVESNTASDRHGMHQMGEFNEIGHSKVLTGVPHYFSACRAPHQSPLVAWDKAGQIKVFTTIEVEIEEAIVK